MTHARLITPEGDDIELNAEVYRQIKRLLDTHQTRKTSRSKKQVDAAIRAGYGLLASKESLTQALLQERAVERTREQAKISRSGG